MESIEFYVGIDVSKSWLDISIYQSENGIVYRNKINNTQKAIKEFLQELKKIFKSDFENYLFIMEQTGKYGDNFLSSSIKKNLKVWVELPLQIKRSMGLVRGKSDKWDAERIAMYGYRFRDKVNIWVPSNPTLQKLKALQTKRSLLVKTHRQLSQENKNDIDFKGPLRSIKKSIESIDSQIEKLIIENDVYKNQNTLLQSIPGIGPQTATALIIATQGFTRLTDPRKLSCYVGIAPFEYSSGSSIRGKTKVSKMGDLTLKTLLNLSAWNAIRSIPSLKEFFNRKVAQGKHKLSVINAIRNKLVAIIMAIIKRETAFVKN